MRQRAALALGLILAAWLWTSAARADISQAEENPPGQPASELLLTNTADLVGLFLEGYTYPLGSWVWTPTVFQPMTIVWADTTNLPVGLAGITNSVPTSVSGVPGWPLWVTLWPQSNTVTVLQPWSDGVLTEFSVPDGFPSWQVYETDLSAPCILSGINYTNWVALVEEGYTQFSVPQVVTHAWLMDLSNQETYWNNVEADWVAADAATASATSAGGGFMSMDNLVSCVITDESVPFSAVSLASDGVGDMVLTWQSCTDHVYIVQSESSLTPTSSWTDVAWMFGMDQQTSWTDTNAVGLTQNFYRVIRANPNELNNGLIPYGWAVTYGLDPLDPNLPWEEDADGEGYANYTEFLNGTNPSQPGSPMDVLVNQGNAYTTSLTIPIQPLSTNYPDVLMAVDPSMANAITLPTSGGATDYTLADSEGVHYLYFQYADAQGNPHSHLIYKTVTVDRVPPHVEITSPASNAVLNQAFITLQGVVFDPDPMLTPDARPLSIWINGVPYWDRLGTNVTVSRYPVPSGTNLFTVTIQAVDAAGNTNQATQTWTVDPSGATNAPQLSAFNITTNMLLPNVNSVWVEAALDNSNALVNAIVTSAAGTVTTNVLGVQGLLVNGLVPLQSGTNQVALIASDAAGNTSSNAFTIISSTEFSAVITNPVLGAFAAAPSNTVSGYVSALVDVGLPTQTNVVGVMINGVAAVLGTDVDTNGNVSFTTTNAVPVGVPITGQVLTNTSEDSSVVPLALPPVPSLQFSVLHHEWHTDHLPGGMSYIPEEDSVAYCAITCDQWWEDEIRYTQDDVADASGLTDQYQWSQLDNAAGHCVGNPLPEGLSWVAYLSGSSSCVSNSPPGCTVNLSGSASFGTWSIDGSGNFLMQCAYPGWGDYPPYCAQGFYAVRGWDRGALTFQMPAQTDTSTTFQITFQGVDYMRASSTPRDLSQVTYRGQNPVTYSNDAQKVAYLVDMNGGAQYTLNQDSFGWPASVYPAILTNNEVPFAGTVKAHWLQWTDFVIDKLTVQLASSNPTNVCVSYTYVNPNNSQVLIYNTNQVVLTAAGSPDDGTGVYTWSHSRGGTFSPNGTHAATNTTYSAPELAFATPAGSRDTVSVTYTYHGAVASTNATLNLLRPKTLVVTGYGVEAGGSPNCSATNGTSFSTAILYDIKDQFGNLLGGPAASMAAFETFDTFVVGSPIVANSGTLNGIQYKTLDGFPNAHTNDMIAPGQKTLTQTWVGDRFYRNPVEAGTNEVFWNSTSASNPALKMNQKLTLQGAVFSTGTIIWYCDGTANPPSGAKLLRGGSEPTVGTQINANN